MNIARRIIELREQKGYSTNKLAMLSGLSQGFVRQVELGEKQPTIVSLEKICIGLGITLGTFFADETADRTKKIPSDMKHIVDSFIQCVSSMTPKQRNALQFFLEQLKN